MSRVTLFSAVSALFILTGAAVPIAHGAVEAVVSVADQKMAILRDGGLVARYPVSTSKFGVGDACRSYKTPLGKLKVCDKIGDGMPLGAVIKHRQMTGEVLPVNAPGRDPIVTRILWLEGCESQNANARERSIYIHGTPEESRIGKPVSWGCVRMRSQDVIALYEELSVGASVTIMAEKLPKYPKYVPPPVTPEIIVAKKDAKGLPPIAAAEMSAKTPAVTAGAGKATENGLAMASVGGKAAGRQAEKTVASNLPVRASMQFSTAAVSAANAGSRATSRPDLTQAMRSSILLSGVEDHSQNSEIPRLER